MNKLITAILSLTILLASTKWCFAEIPEIAIQTVAMESSNQDMMGQYMVAKTIVNRARISNKSLTAICLKPKAYSCWNKHGKWAKAWLGRYYTLSARKQAVIALNRALNDRLDCWTYYHEKSVRPYWSKGSHGKLHGDQVFYEAIGE